MSSIQLMMGSVCASVGPSMAAGALVPLAIGMVYPQLEAMPEAGIRKVTLEVVWSEGSIERDLSTTQSPTHSQRPAVSDTPAPSSSS